MANNLWAAFIANNGSNDILVASAPDGVNWTPSVPINETSPFTPSLALFEGKLYVAFITDDENSATGVPSNRIFLCSTTDGVSWSNATFFHQHSKFAPSLAVWNGKLHVAFVANNSSNTLLVYYSSTPGDPSSWSATVAVNQTSANAPSLAAYGPSGQTGDLYLAFVANNGSGDIFVCSLPAGGVWSKATVTGQACHFSPSLAVFGPTLYLAFAAANGSKDLLLCSRNANGTWSGAVPMNQSSSATPCAVAFGPNLSAGFIANNSGREVLLASASNPSSWTGGTVDVRQQSAAGPSFAVAPFACCWQLAPAHDRPLAGNQNYFLYGGTTTPPIPNLLKLKIVIEITSSIVCGKAFIPHRPRATATQGFDFQLNTYSPIGATTNTFQQFVISFQPEYTGDGTITTGPKPALSCSVETFGSSNLNAHIPGSDGKVPGYFPVEAATPETLPAGYVFTIELTNDSSGNVVKADFEAVDNNGKTYKWSFSFGSQGQQIPGGVGSPFTSNGKPAFGPGAAAPVASFQFNVCGVNGGAFTPLTSAEGMITYTSTTTMTVDDDQPACSTSLGAFTTENTNCAFGQLPSCPSQTFVQPFFLPPA
jgi:hypothetical protein